MKKLFAILAVMGVLTLDQFSLLWLRMKLRLKQNRQR